MSSTPAGSPSRATNTAVPAGAAGAGPVAAKPAEPGPGVWYWVKWGDTLWDLAGTYYRNPWLYPKIAKANRIKNPDLIFAETKLLIPQI